MKRLNALDWADGLCLVAYGFRIGIRVTVPELLPQLLDQLPPDWRPSTTRKVQVAYSLSSVPSRRRPGSLLHQLYEGGGLLTRGSDFQRVKRTFGQDVRAHLAILSPWRTFIHAGAVGWKGRALVIPGASGSGKTTLTAALVRAGATLLSDEFAVLDRKGYVHPYPLPLRIKTDESPTKKALPLSALGGTPAKRPLPVGLILATHFDAEARGGLRRMSAGRAALALMSHAVQARIRPSRVLESTGRAAEGALALQGPRGEAEEMVDMLLDLM